MSNHELNEDHLAKRLFEDVPEIKHEPLIGYYSDIYAGHAKGGNYREAGSSGGIATWLLVQLLNEGLIDGVIHVHPCDPHKDGVLFKYAISSTEEAVRSGAKSRYYPMDLSEVLKATREHGGRYAVTGIPSFITELRLLAAQDPEFSRAIAYTIGLICGHQKSTKYVEAIAWEHGIRPGDLRSADFRKKVEGKMANEYITELIGFKDGAEITIAKEASEVFVSSWAHGFFKPKFSDFTDDLFNETADVAVGDAWLPEYQGDYRGSNLLILRHPELARIISRGVETGDLSLDVLSANDAVASQSGLVRHSYRELPYRLARADRRGAWRPLKRLDADGSLSRLRKNIQDVRERISEQSHVHYKKAVELDDWNYFVQKMTPLVDKHNALYTITETRRILRKGPTFLFKRAHREIQRRMRHARDRPGRISR
ncbi:Coenzyme F420 hydrogenase/dehydrogenase, beta subunit C-terminal domain [Nesterenkonia populi]|uniref:Coenzyme F420 hydrogenase/dehydrogenase, beta subunit C-terminal domain n=1 Tax=Nesterenkonia populi TaxID=1591087 RepID=UPI0011BD6D27|nr:Coenzyme F420 hydrogenase/dehydrogenase, beta subunit C-terminal domain [Nesterenkonia populi]